MAKTYTVKTEATKDEDKLIEVQEGIKSTFKIADLKSQIEYHQHQIDKLNSQIDEVSDALGFQK